MPEVPLGPDKLIASRHPDPLLEGDSNFSFESFQLNGELTAAGLDEDEQRLIFLYRCMKTFEERHGHQADTQNGRIRVHRSFIHKKAPRHEQRKFTYELVKRLAAYRSALEDSPTFFIVFNQESRPGSTINAATLHERNIYYQIPRQFSQDILIRSAFKQFISTLAEVSLDCVVDFPLRASFSTDYIAKSMPCTIERGVPIVFKSNPDIASASATQTFTAHTRPSSYSSSIPAGFATPKRTGGYKSNSTSRHASIATAELRTSSARTSIGHRTASSSMSRTPNAPSSRAQGSRASTQQSSRPSATLTGSILDLSDVDEEEFEHLSLGGEENPFQLPQPCTCGLPGGKHTGGCESVKSWVYTHSRHF